MPQRIELAVQPAGRRRIAPRRQHLQRDGRAGARVDRAVDGPEAAAPDLPLEPEWTEPTAHER